jgi:hypothetical protein
MTTTQPFMLTGDTLVQFVNERKDLIDRGELTRTDLIKDAGYLNSNGTAAYVDFYTELLRAKGVTPVTDTDVNNTAYDDLDSDTKALYDAVDDRLGEKWNHEDMMLFLEHLSEECDITTADEFNDNFEGVYDSEEEFAVNWVADVMNAQIPECVYHCIDWDAVWNRELRYDFDSFDFQYDTYIFRK